jgi:DNA-binding transcriptional MerR regulator
MKSRERAWTVGEVAERFGLETHVLRHWESVGLLAPARDAGGRRRYGQDDVVRIAVVVRSKAAGMSLEQIRELLDNDGPTRHRVLSEHLAQLDRRLGEIEVARAMTEHAFRCGAHDITTCPRFRAHLADLMAGFAQ